jgi:hypothetical protein
LDEAKARQQEGAREKKSYAGFEAQNCVLNKVVQRICCILLVSNFEAA